MQELPHFAYEQEVGTLSSESWDETHHFWI